MILSEYVGKYKKMPIEAKASLWYLVCNVLQNGVSFFVIPIYTRVLTTEEYGSYTVFQSWRELIMVFATLNFSAGIFTRGLVKKEKERTTYTAQMQGLSFTVTVCSFLGVLLFLRPFQAMTGFDVSLIVVLFVYYIFNPSFLFWTVRQRVENRYKSMVAVTIVISFLIPIISIVLLSFSSLRANALIYTFLAIQILAGLFFFIKQFKDGRSFYSRTIWGESFKFNVPLIPHYLSLIVLAQLDRLMIDRICGTSYAGIYSLSYNIGQVVLILVAAINGAFVPWMYKNLRSRNYKSISHVSTALCACLGLISILVMLLAPEVIYFMGGMEYMSAQWCIPPIVMGSFFTFCYGLFATIEFYEGNTIYVAVASVAGSLLNIGLNLFFIPMFGFIAAAYTTELSYFALMIFHYIFMKKISSYRTFNMVSITICCLVVFTMSLLLSFVYEHEFIRWGGTLFIFFLIYLKRKTLQQLFKNLRSCGE